MILVLLDGLSLLVYSQTLLSILAVATLKM